MRLLVVEDDEKLAKILSTSLSVIGDFFVTFEIEYGTSKFEVEIGAINILWMREMTRPSLIRFDRTCRSLAWLTGSKNFLKSMSTTHS